MNSRIDQILVEDKLYDISDRYKFTGTKAEVEQAITEGIIKEGYIVNITDDPSGVGGVSSSTLDTKEEIEANTQPNMLVGANAIKEIINDVNDINELNEQLTSSINELSGQLINENNESFNYGVKDGVRGFYTDPLRADDSFIPFKKDSILPFFMRLNHNNYATFGWYYIGVIVNGKKYQTGSGNYDNNFPSTFKSGKFIINGHFVYVVGSNLLSSSGQGYLPSIVTLSVYVDSTLLGTYTCSGMGTDSSYQIEGGARMYFPSNGLVEF